VAKRAKSLGERVAEKWYGKDGLLWKREKIAVDDCVTMLARLINREAAKMQREALEEGKKRHAERMGRINAYNLHDSWLTKMMLSREARASCRLDGETQCDPNDIPKPKKVRKRK
jgi:hypothetical protein